ncbi:MAG: DUF4019 domain-containing protein [Myxococcales bacterium]
MFPGSALLAALLAAVSAPADRALPPYSLLTLPTGHFFRVINSGPLLDPKGKRFALAISYLSTAQTQKELHAAAEELFAYLRPHAEHDKDGTILVVARLGSGGEVVDQDVLYERQPSGKWKRTARTNRPFPRSAPTLPEEERDLSGLRAAKQQADAWLALLDSGQYEECCGAAAPFLQQGTTRGGWAESTAAARGSLGVPRLRKLISLMETKSVPSAPPGRYMVVEYQSKYSRRPVAFESVIEMLCDDGEWRVSGYAVR